MASSFSLPCPPCLPTDQFVLNREVLGGVVVIFLFWTLPIFIRGWRILLRRSLTRLETQVLGGFVLVAIALFLGITYTLGADLSIASRYHFVYFPAFIVIIGAALAVCWNADRLTARKD